VVLNLLLLREREMLGNDSFENKKRKLVLYEKIDIRKDQLS
jgi:hypothetical protein